MSCAPVDTPAPAPPCGRVYFLRQIAAPVLKACKKLVKQNDREGVITDEPLAGVGTFGIRDAVRSQAAAWAWYWGVREDTIASSVFEDDATIANKLLLTHKARLQVSEALYAFKLDDDPDVQRAVSEVQRSLVHSETRARLDRDRLAALLRVASEAKYLVLAGDENAWVFDAHDVRTRMSSLAYWERMREHRVTLDWNQDGASPTPSITWTWPTGRLRLFGKPCPDKIREPFVTLDVRACVGTHEQDLQVTAVPLCAVPANEVTPAAAPHAPWPVTEPARVPGATEGTPMKDKTEAKPTATTTAAPAAAPANMAADLDAYGWNASTFRSKGGGVLVVLHTADNKTKLASAKADTIVAAYTEARGKALAAKGADTF